MKPTAVVCDDDYAARAVAALELTDAGFGVVAECAVATELIQVVETVHPHLVVVDVSLVGMTGIEAIPELRRVSPGTAIIVFSSFDAALEAARAAGADAVVDKTDAVELAGVAVGLVFHPTAA